MDKDEHDLKGIFISWSQVEYAACLGRPQFLEFPNFHGHLDWPLILE